MLLLVQILILIVCTNNITAAFLNHENINFCRISNLDLKTAKNFGPWDDNEFQANISKNLGNWCDENTKIKEISPYETNRNMNFINLQAFTQSLGNVERVEKIRNLFHYKLFQLLKEIHNYSYTLRPIYENYNLKTKLPKSFQKSKFNIAVTGCLQIAEEIDEFYVLMPFYKLKTCFFYLRPRKSNISIIKPFAQSTWIATIMTSVLITLFLKISLVFSEAEETTWVFSGMTVFSTLCQDGDDPSPSTRDLGCKIIFLSLLIMSLLLFNFYTSVMVAQLLGGQKTAQITIGDIANSNYEIGIDHNDFVQQWLTTTNLQDVQRLHKKKLKLPNGNLNFFPHEYGFEKIRESSFTYHTDTNTGFDIIGKKFQFDQMCDVEEIKMVPDGFVGLTVNKHFPFKKQFQISLLKLREIGFVDRLMKQIELKKPDCLLDRDVVALGMKEAVPGIICMVIGVLGSLGILALEIALIVFKKKYS